MKYIFMLEFSLFLRVFSHSAYYFPYTYQHKSLCKLQLFQ